MTLNLFIFKLNRGNNQIEAQAEKEKKKKKNMKPLRRSNISFSFKNKTYLAVAQTRQESYRLNLGPKEQMAD